MLSGTHSFDTLLQLLKHFITIIGRKDQVVPPEHMNDLWEISVKSGRKNGVWVEFQNTDHSKSRDISNPTDDNITQIILVLPDNIGIR